MADPFLNANIGEYRVTGFIGEGGMGRVYRAVHTRLNRVVAVKILTAASGDSVFLQRFLNEAQIQSEMSDPGVAALYDFTEFRGSPVILMEYVDGMTIQQITEREGAWSAERALPVLISCARTLQYVYSQGIVHRDLKTANIKVSSSGAVKLLDFGIATGAMAQRLTVAGFVIGTFQSLSPEQTRGEQATPASDVWAFGVLAYEMLTASLPFEGSNAAELFSKIGRASYTSPCVLKPGLPSQVEHVIARCLKREPKDRYQSMEELARDLTRVETRASRLTLPDFRSDRPRRTLLVAGGVVLFVALAFGGYELTQRSPAADGGGVEGSGSVHQEHPPPAESNDPQLRTVVVETQEGSADVWENSRRIGTTPFEFHRNFGDQVSAVLKRPGYQDKPIHFDVGVQPSYEFTLERREDRSPPQ